MFTIFLGTRTPMNRVQLINEVLFMADTYLDVVNEYVFDQTFEPSSFLFVESNRVQALVIGREQRGAD